MQSPRSGGDMRRRKFLGVLGATAVAWPLAARAQQAQRARRVGVLMGTGNDTNGQARLAAVREELQKHGWIEGRNLSIRRSVGSGRHRSDASSRRRPGRWPTRSDPLDYDSD